MSALKLDGNRDASFIFEKTREIKCSHSTNRSPETSTVATGGGTPPVPLPLFEYILFLDLTSYMTTCYAFCEC